MDRRERPSRRVCITCWLIFWRRGSARRQQSVWGQLVPSTMPYAPPIRNESVGGCTAGDVDGVDYIIVSGTFELQDNPVAVTSNVYLIGTNSAVLDGLGSYRFFHVAADGVLDIQDVTMTKGRGSSSRGQIYLASGASLSLSDSPITECVRHILHCWLGGRQLDSRQRQYSLWRGSANCGAAQRKSQQAKVVQRQR